MQAQRQLLGGLIDGTYHKERFLHLQLRLRIGLIIDWKIVKIHVKVNDEPFTHQTVAASCALARHRKANSVDVRDVQHVLGE